MKKHRFGALVAAGILALSFAGTAFAASPVTWNGVNGWPVKEDCKDSNPGEMLWIYTGESDSDVVLTMNGDEYTGVQMGKSGEGSWHIVTPYTESKPTASLVYTGDYIDGVLTISHGCPGTTTTTTTTTTQSTETQSTTTTTTSDTTTTTTSNETTTSNTTTEPETTTSSTTTKTTSTGTEEEKTPPQTDTIGQSSTSSVSSGLFLVFAGLLALALVVPAKARSRR